MSTFAYFSVWLVLAFDHEMSSSVEEEGFKMGNCVDIFHFTEIVRD